MCLLQRQKSLLLHYTETEMDRMKNIAPFVVFFLVALANLLLASCSETTSKSGSSEETGPIGPDPLAAYQWYLFNSGDSYAAAFSATKGGNNHANITAVHEKLKITGTGITVNIMDSGLQLTHPDLRTNLSKSFDYLENDNNPQPIDDKGDHGTSVAGIIGMKKNNATGGIGVAPGVTLIGHAFVGRVLITMKQNSLMLGLNGSATKATEIAQVYNQSFGTEKSTMNANKVSETETETETETQRILRSLYESGTKLGRNKKGYIYIKSAGNGYQSDITKDSRNNSVTLYRCNSGHTSCKNSSEDFRNTLPENVVVSATNAAGKLSSYSTTGSSIWVSAPGGEHGYGDIKSVSDTGYKLWGEVFFEHKLGLRYLLEPAMVTTDITGCSIGYSREIAQKDKKNLFEYGESQANDLNKSCDYTSTFNGTSSAAPVVSGVVALMLEANPNLGWRDVKHILATTSDKLDEERADFVHSEAGITIDHSWVTNAAEHAFSNHYGFGQVNGYRAVLAARNYSNYLTNYTADTGEDTGLTLKIPNNSATGASTTISLNKKLKIESVRVTVSIKGGTPYDLALALKSPQETISSLLPSGSYYKASEGYSIKEFTFLTNAFYEELSTGTWTLSIYDLHSTSESHLFGSSDEESVLEKWSIEINGHPAPK